MWYSAIITLTIFICVCSTCLITNCPKGGKRAGSLSPDSHNIRQCARCGPAKLGHCYGPAICCGPQIGCLIATPDTARCMSEAASPIPCVAPIGPQCGEGKSVGRCTANGVCCTHESCHADISCRLTISDVAELTEGNSEQINTLYKLYNTISNSYQQENLNSGLTSPDGETK